MLIRQSRVDSFSFHHRQCESLFICSLENYFFRVCLSDNKPTDHHITSKFSSTNLLIDDWGISCEIALRWMPLDLMDDKSVLIQIMAWCLKAPSHHLNQCWTQFIPPYGITRPPWVKVVTEPASCAAGLCNVTGFWFGMLWFTVHKGELLSGACCLLFGWYKQVFQETLSTAAYPIPQWSHQ